MQMKWVLGMITVAVVATAAYQMHDDSAAESRLQAMSHDAALHDCRMQQPGRVNRRLNLPATNARIAACVARKVSG
jgi:hypothetical protein